MIFGTPYFASYSAAVRYYSDYDRPDTESWVDSMLDLGVIHIGSPTLKAGQKLFLDEGRYFVKDGN